VRGSLLLVALSLVVCGLAAHATVALGRPNVLVIVTDDQRLDGTMAVMPKTETWFHTGGDPGNGAGTVTGGAFFPNAVANTPWCCPARSSIFTGEYAHNHGVENLQGWQLGTTESSPKQQQTLQAYLKRPALNYMTGIFGKYLNNWQSLDPDGSGPLKPAKFDCAASSKDAPPAPPFFDEYAIFESSSYSPTCVLENGGGLDHWVWQYSTTWVQDKAIKFLDAANAAGKPWLLYVTPYAPHSPFLPESRYQDAAVSDLPQTASVFETDRSDKPPWVQTEIHDSDVMSASWKDHLRQLMSADDMVDAIMRKVRDLNQDNDTIAFFTSDNGMMWGDHGGDDKARPYMGSINVPFYMRWPGWASYQSNATDQRLTALIDIVPTVMDAIGTSPDPTDPKDGMSLLDQSNQRNRILTEEGRGAPAVPPWLSILTPTYHYIESYQNGIGSPPTYREYYDLTADPLELKNLLGDDDPLNDPPTAGLSAKLAADRACSGSDCPPGGGDPPLEAKITRGPADGDGNSGSTQPIFYFTSSQPGSTFECELTGPTTSISWSSCADPVQYNGLADGDYTFGVRAVQPGPVYSDPQTYAWHIDSSVPETAITVHPAKRSATQTASFEFTSSKAPQFFRCRFDGGPWQDCMSPLTFQVTDTPVSAPHRFEVKAVNFVAEDPTPASYEWSVDSTPMEINPVTFRPTTASYERQASFDFTTRSKPESAEPPGTEVPARFECNLNGAAWKACGSKIRDARGKVKFTKQYTGLANGHYTFSVRVVDLAGNVSAPRSYSWNVGPAQSYNTSPNPTWPDVSAGTEVRVVIPDLCSPGGWYVGGTFTAVGGVPVTNLAHIRGDKTVDSQWMPAVGKSTGMPSVRALLLRGSTLYVGGDFTDVNGVARSNLAAVTAAGCTTPTAAAVTSWDPESNKAVYALADKQRSDGTLDTDVIYAAGAFTGFGQTTLVSRQKVAEIKTADGNITGWDAHANGGATLLTVASSRGTVYVGGSGLTSIGGRADVRNLAELDQSTALATSWNPRPDGVVNWIRWRRFAIRDAVGSAGQLPTVLVAGSFNKIGAPAADGSQPTRSRVAELGASDAGYATPWNPSASGIGGGAGWRVLPINTYDTIIGGAFTNVGPAGRARLVETDRVTGSPLDWNPGLDAAAFELNYQEKNPSDGFIGPPLISVGGNFGDGSPAYPRRLLAFYCRIDLPVDC
jgi:arylsulfatase A-like enzyme